MADATGAPPPGRCAVCGRPVPRRAVGARVMGGRLVTEYGRRLKYCPAHKPRGHRGPETTKGGLDGDGTSQGESEVRGG
jgi:hypothetical protein